MTTNIVRKKGNFKLTVDQDGNATLSGSVGSLNFKGDSALSGLGAKIKNVSIMFSRREGNNVIYTAMYSFGGAANITISGNFDMEKLLKSCSGFLCHAVRAAKKKDAAYDMEMKRSIGY
jgi:hypothetical protein